MKEDKKLNTTKSNLDSKKDINKKKSNNSKKNKSSNTKTKSSNKKNVNTKNKNNSSKKNKNIVLIILIIILIGLISLSLSLHFLLNKKGNNTNINESNNVNEKMSYEIKTLDDIKLLYVNGKQVEEIKADSELGDIKAEEFKDALIVDETNPGPSRRLFVVDKNANAIELDYKVSTYNEELISFIDSYRIEGNNLYIKVNRQWGNGYIDWYCRYNDKDEIAEYEVKYEYSNGKFIRKEVLNELSIKDKYKNEDCISSEDKKINYVVKEIYESTIGTNWSYLYVNGKKVENIEANPDNGAINVQEYKDILIVEEDNLYSSRLFVVDGDGNVTELDYKVSTYNQELGNRIDSYRIEGNNLYVKVNRSYGNGLFAWYCHYSDKDEIAEYEVKYEYSNGKFIRKEILNEISIKDKYKNENCSNAD